MIRTLINLAMKIERQAHLGAGPYEWTPARQDYANGYKPKTVNTWMGAITFNVPQVRKGDFYPQALEKGIRSERALKLALAEMYVQGVSTRKVAAITRELCGEEVSSTQVSQAAAELDAQLEAWRNRPLGRFRYLYFDAIYLKVRRDGQVRDAGTLIATGVNEEGKREILGVSVALSEQEVHWRTIFQSLTQRGLHGVELIISDAHSGMKQGRKAVFGSVPWQRPLAALSVSSSTECASLCAAKGYEKGGSRRYQGCIQRFQPPRGGPTAGAGCPEIWTESFQTRDMDGREYSGRTDGIQLSARTSAAVTHL